MTRRLLLIALAVGVLAAFTAAAVASRGGGSPRAPRPKTGAVPWRAPSDPMRRTVLAGLVPAHFETLKHHVHSHLDVFVNGRHEVVPAAIGIDTHNPGVHHAPAPDGSLGYGGIRFCKRPCISPLHTHAHYGILHTESASAVPNKLGEFFTEWGVRLTPRCVGGYCKPDSIRIYVDGRRYLRDPRRIRLTNLREIAIVIGSPPRTIPKSFPRDIPFL